jgi:hypothetical protein
MQVAQMDPRSPEVRDFELRQLLKEMKGELSGAESLEGGESVEGEALCDSDEETCTAVSALSLASSTPRSVQSAQCDAANLRLLSTAVRCAQAKVSVRCLCPSLSLSPPALSLSLPLSLSYFLCVSLSPPLSVCVCVCVCRCAPVCV